MAMCSQIIAQLETKLELLELPDTVGAADHLTAVYTLEDWLTAEADRRFLVLITSGPARALSRSRCADQISLSVRVRYFSDRESRGRMVDDAALIRECLKGTADITDLSGSPAVSGPTYDYGQWPGANAVGVKFDLVVEYHHGDTA